MALPLWAFESSLALLHCRQRSWLRSLSSRFDLRKQISWLRSQIWKHIAANTFDPCHQRRATIFATEIMVVNGGSELQTTSSVIDHRAHFFACHRRLQFLLLFLWFPSFTWFEIWIFVLCIGFSSSPRPYPCCCDWTRVPDPIHPILNGLGRASKIDWTRSDPTWVVSFDSVSISPSTQPDPWSVLILVTLFPHCSQIFCLNHIARFCYMYHPTTLLEFGPPLTYVQLPSSNNYFPLSTQEVSA